MSIPTSLLFLCIGLSATKKEGDFGIFTGCNTKNDSLRLECSYAPCTGSPSFDCEIRNSSLGLLYKGSNYTCQYIIPGHRHLYSNVTTIYGCTLTRKARIEEKTIDINYSIRKGRGYIKPCRGSAGVLLQQRRSSMWPLVILPLWRVLVTVS